MLTRGDLSPDDLAIRPGENKWQKLSLYFPGAGNAAMAEGSAHPAFPHIETTPFSKISPHSGNISPAQAKTSGGCFRSILRLLEILLLVVGSILVTVTGGAQPGTSCDRAEEYAAKLKQLISELQVAKRTPKETKLKGEIASEIGIPNKS